TPLHPSQIYESLLTLVIFVVLIWLAPRKKFHGQVALTYVVLYSVTRFSLEFYRGDAGRGFFGPLSTSQWVAIVLVLAAAAVFPRLRKARVVTPAAA
ncbi:MAG TPA: prolipoprotein diacylglyceryl transferase family protein, partial [Vicinamibacteria bacterium]|nr:prolipoprotein diacylglyceryl transferase family protein [Vicinamibacteria bacterium]